MNSQGGAPAPARDVAQISSWADFVAHVSGTSNACVGMDTWEDGLSSAEREREREREREARARTGGAP